MLVFVYGTLSDPDGAEAVLDGWAFEDDAELVGLHRVEGAYPTLAPGGRVEGRLLRTDEVGRLDAYEGVNRGLYVRVEVPLAGEGAVTEDATVAVYVGDPDALNAPAEWPGEGEFADRVAGYLVDHDVVVRRSPADDSTRWGE